MLPLYLWLRLRGEKVQDELWEIYPYNRVRVLLEIWGGAWVIKKTIKARRVITNAPPTRPFVISIPREDFDGEIVGSWKVVQAEMERMDRDVKSICKRFLSMSPTDGEKIIIHNVTQNLLFEVTELERLGIAIKQHKSWV